MRTGARTSVEGWDDARADDEETPVLASGRKRASVDSWRRCAWVIVASACIAALGLIFEVDGAVSAKTGARRFSRRQHRGGNDEARSPCAGNVSHVALLVAGSTRSFVLPSGHGGMKRFLIDELERGSCVKVHTVMDLAVNDASGTHPGVEVFPKIFPHVLRQAIDVINPTVLTFHEAHHLQLDLRDPFGRDCPATTYASPETSKVGFDTDKRLLCMAKRLEKDLKIEFSWYIRTRPDLMWSDPIPSTLFNLLSARDGETTLVFDSHWKWPINDQFYAIHRTLADPLWAKGSKIFNDIPCAATYQENLGPEGLLKHAAQINGAMPRGVPLNHASVAQPDGNLWCSQEQQCKEFNRRFKAEVKAYAVQVQQWLATGEHDADPPVSPRGFAERACPLEM